MTTSATELLSKYSRILLGTIVLGSGMTACSSTPSDTKSDLNLDIKMTYFNARDDNFPSRSSKPVLSSSLDKRITNDGDYNRVILGHSVVTICPEPSNCSQSSNLAKLNYVVVQGSDSAVIQGEMINEMGASTTNSSPQGYIKWSIADGAKLHSSGTKHQDFTLPLIKGKALSLTGPLGDRLVISIE